MIFCLTRGEVFAVEAKTKERARTILATELREPPAALKFCGPLYFYKRFRRAIPLRQKP